MSKFEQVDPLVPDDGDSKFFGNERRGRGRWVSISLGVLWTNDSSSLQCMYRPDVDSVRVADFQTLLNAYATAGLSASDAFEVVVADEGSPPVTTGELAQLD